MIEEKNLLKWYDEEYCLFAIDHDWRSLQYIRKQTEKICLDAIEQNSYAIMYVHDQTEKICLEALNQDINNIEYIDVEKFPLIYEKYQFMTL